MRRKDVERLVGKRVRKFFPGHGWFEGRVTKRIHRESVVAVLYDDGDSEHMTVREVRDILIGTPMLTAGIDAALALLDLRYAVSFETSSPRFRGVIRDNHGLWRCTYVKGGGRTVSRWPTAALAASEWDRLGRRDGRKELNFPSEDGETRVAPYSRKPPTRSVRSVVTRVSGNTGGVDASSRSRPYYRGVKQSGAAAWVATLYTHRRWVSCGRHSSAEAAARAWDAAARVGGVKALNFPETGTSETRVTKRSWLNGGI